MRTETELEAEINDLWAKLEQSNSEKNQWKQMAHTLADALKKLEQRHLIDIEGQLKDDLSTKELSKFEELKNKLP